MDDEPGGLVYRQNLVVFVDDVERQRLRSQRSEQPREPDDALSPTETMGRLEHRAVGDRHKPIADLALHFRARDATVQCDEELVKALSLVFGPDRPGNPLHWGRNSFVHARSVPYNTVVVSPEG
ncbi:MAG: hypothetical protein NTV92_00065 [Candidatus Bipolaricaulota bacterium]|nr:hypothetical protein [Candidatus Bipolaricaulota bacterium]